LIVTLGNDGGNKNGVRMYSGVQQMLQFWCERV